MLDDAKPRAIISYETWQSFYAGDKDILGKTLTIRGINHRIIGVMSEAFSDPETFDVGREVNVWLNWNHNWSKQMGWNDWQNTEEAIQIMLFSPNQYIANEIASLNVQLNEAWQAQMSHMSNYQGWSIALNAIELQNAIFGDQQLLIYLVAIACLGVFIICIANTTNLLLSRTAEKQYHLSIQAAIGAKPRHIRRQIFAEILVIMGMTVPVCLLVCFVGFDLIRQYLDTLLPRANELSLNSFNVLLCIGLLFLVSLIFTYFCARTINYLELRQALASSGKGQGAQISQRTRNNLIISQVTIAALLIFVNLNLFLNAFQTVTAPSTLAMENRWQLRLTAKNPTELGRESLRHALDEMKQSFAQHPAVAQVSQSLSPLIWSGTFAFTMVDDNQSFATQAKFVDENYFSLLEQPMLEGDNFTREQIRDRANVVIVNEELARQITANGDVVGKQMQFWGRNHTIIGVVKGAKKPNVANIPPMRYTPDRGERPVYIVHFKPGKALSKQAVLDFIHQENRHFTLFSYRQIKADHDRLLFAHYTTLLISAVMTLLTIVLASIGLYGVLNYSSQMRRREFGTRLALGAKRFDIVKLVLKDNTLPVAVGMAISTLGLVILGLWQKELVQQWLAAQILLTALTTVAVCLFISALSSYMPLRNAINFQVINSLRGS